LRLGATGVPWQPQRVSWHGVALDRPDFSDSSHSLAATLHCDGFAMHLILNAYWERLTFELPALAAGKWWLLIDTFQPSPRDIDLAGTKVPSASIVAEPRSILVLSSEPAQAPARSTAQVPRASHSRSG
jgi:isoamylase